MAPKHLTPDYLNGVGHGTAEKQDMQPRGQLNLDSPRSYGPIREELKTLLAE